MDEEFKVEQLVDKIYCLEVIEHIYFDQGSQMLSHFQRVLRPGGHVFLTTPNYRSMWPVIEWLLDRFQLVPRLADDQHVEHYHRKKLRQLAESVGFKIEQVLTTCFTAPWLAPLNWKLAQTVNHFESGRMAPGSIVVAILRKQDHQDAEHVQQVAVDRSLGNIDHEE